MKKILIIMMVSMGVSYFINLKLNTPSPIIEANGQSELMKKMMEEHHKIMQEFMDSMEKDFFNDDFFQDDFKSKTFGSRGMFLGSNAIAIEKETMKDGSSKIRITPKSENTTLEIKTENGQIEIDGTISVGETNENSQNGHKRQSQIQSKYKQVISIPSNMKVKGPVKEGKSLVLFIVPLNDDRSIGQLSLENTHKGQVEKNQSDSSQSGTESRRNEIDQKDLTPLRPGPGDINI